MTRERGGVAGAELRPLVDVSLLHICGQAKCRASGACAKLCVHVE